MSGRRTEELMRPPRPNSRVVPDAALRSLRLSEVRHEYVVAGELALYSAALAFGDRFEVVPSADRSRRMMGNRRYAREPRPTRSWRVPHPDKPLSNVATMRRSCGASVGSCSDTIFQPLAPARQPRHDCTERNTSNIRNLPV